MILPPTLELRHGATQESVPPPPHHKPRLTELLESLRLDVDYERGDGCYLYGRDEQGAEVEVLDLVGGYGSLLLGHAHPELVAEAQRLLASGIPIHAQGTRSAMAERLASALSRRAQGDYCVVFGNSGTEAIEAAVKHAMLENGARTFIALERGFHGKTLGALQLTAHLNHRGGWETPGLSVIRVPLNDGQALDRAFAEAGRPAGFIYEPVQGEGGVHAMDPAFAQRAAGLCRATGAPLIADECQTGLGRTGTFLASEQLGVRPDYIVLSKALGGGLAKISALLVRRDRYCDAFDLKHTSTFAGDAFSCAIALKVLDLVRPELMTACREKGDRLMRGLATLAARYPSVVSEVRGQGLLAAIQFRRLRQSPSFVLRLLSAQEDLTYALTSHLLARHRLRVAPTLSDPFVLRLEPSALIDDQEIDRTVQALDSVCQLLEAGDAVNLMRHLGNGRAPESGYPRCLRDDHRLVFFNEPRDLKPSADAPPVKVAWLCHMIDDQDFISLDSSFSELSRLDRNALLNRWLPRASPVVMSRVAVRSTRGTVVEFLPIMLPFTSRWVKEAMDARSLDAAQELVQRGVETAEALGCRLVSLGQYTSMVTMNGTRLDPRGLGITTGNSYAIALAMQAVARACRDGGIEPSASTVAVAGATGNIGRTCAQILARHFRRIILIGSSRSGSLARLKTLAASLPDAVVATDLSAAARAEVVVAAMNSVEAPIESAHLAPGAVVCDLSIPASVLPDLNAHRPDVRIILGGLAALPFAEDLRITGFPRPAGQIYACMAEAMILGFEDRRDRWFTGSLSPDHVTHIARLANHHGFKLAAYKESSVLGSPHHEPAFAIAR